jgi:uncharacterized protein YdeI (YjbR/CyaY-like superfamily)
MRIGSRLLQFETPGQWRAWLRKNGAVDKEAWLVLHKKRTGRSSITLEEATEEALCFGWIDSSLQRIDDDSYALRYTPRRKRSPWSEINRRRAAKLIRQGRMTDAGLAAIEEAKRNGEWNKAPHRVDVGRVPSDLRTALATSGRARTAFDKLAPSYKRQFLGWIANAKTDATRARRIQKTISLLEEDRKLGD